ncbi:hypothetical protein D0X99_11860 [Algoriphagus lacus]|uniref:Uncharacterized protein n=1 Tax=Algoriphagus lacus TaxID=2056311 RepID=A0A418PRD5_9BACT|nr:hypothetical protein [Algoriphagus lacus]RIW15135.1 hypothetical protein D0X99_11860 [Algoriphagus lacus]
MNRFRHTCILFLFSISLGLAQTNLQKSPVQLSGIYPHLAYYNNEGECGTGAVVPWAGKLWVITYGPHLPYGSSDKLYEIDEALNLIIRPESIGGTPANRMVHRESNQLFIGPYAIDAQGNLRVIPYSQMPGRHTGNARHLTDPEGKIYYATMEEGFYEVNVHSLAVTKLYEDANVSRDTKTLSPEKPYSYLLPGAHGKGAYSGQGVLVYSNNGEPSDLALKQFDIQSGSLSEWDGKDWKVVRRNQFVEVTGPGGIYGNKDPENDPIWATGWDHKSAILGVREKSGWTFYRFPKASHSYDGAHGWNTEWPRIRDIGTPDSPRYLMTMHGMFWDFPENFSSKNSKGIRPRSAYLKVIGDFTRWNDRLVFGTDDSAQKEFLNKRASKGGIEGPGQSNSNLWFTDLNLPDQLGPATANGTIWLNEEIPSGVPSEPMLFAGWKNKVLWIQNQGQEEVTFSISLDLEGNGTWRVIDSLKMKPNQSKKLIFPDNLLGEWIKITPDKTTKATAHLAFSNEDKRVKTPATLFAGLLPISSEEMTGGLLYGLGNDRRKLGIAASKYANGTEVTEAGYYELDEKLNLVKTDDPETNQFIREKFAIPSQVFTVEEGSVLIVDDKNRRWRLPLGSENFTEPSLNGELRICREVATERDLFNCHGTFYELPAENADGYAKIRPIASHNYKINDYASYRGMLVMTGVDSKESTGNEHIITSTDGKLSIWAGAIDDLWKMGKPTGNGGPWVNSEIKSGEASDPYLFGFYDQKELKLSHASEEIVTFSIEFEPIGHGPWMAWKEVEVKPGETVVIKFPDGLEARWIRFRTDRDCKATTWLSYQ